MKYLVLLCDGAADYKCESLGGKTPLEAARKPLTDLLAGRALCGTVSNVPEGMVPESDTANLAVMSYDPKIYSKGRSPLEAISMGLEMDEDQTAFRCNLVTLSEGDCEYEHRIMIDNSADEISTEEADELIKAIDEALGDSVKSFHTGISYRHCLLWKDAPVIKDFARPHDILDRDICDYLPPEPFLELYKRSYEILKDHPVNVARRARGKRAANSIWLWSPGKKPQLPNFEEKWGLKASVISAVDLIKGIGLCAGMDSVDVEGATGTYETNYEGKAEAAINEFKKGKEFVYVHFEGPDECGHRAETENKVKSLELIDEKMLRPVYDYLVSSGEAFRIIILPDHPTPVSLRTHSKEPVPFMIYMSDRKYEGITSFCEELCEEKGFYVERGEELLDLMIERKGN
ncbi:MAG: cofactor-independent phosphoglycerate mutase [Ruminococcaceae bacterium]|nr:cofactor-independent phosphoglycerate mutase [Oscillospiraceae bacterium]